MNYSHQKILAKFEKRYWHECKLVEGKLSTCSCGMTGLAVREICDRENPTYTTDADMLRVFRKMTPGEFHSFCNGTWHIWCDSHRNRVLYHSDFHRWLIDNPERALCLAADWIKERGKG